MEKREGISIILSAGAERAVGRLALPESGAGIVLVARPASAPRPSGELDELVSALLEAGFATLDVSVRAPLALGRHARLLTQAARASQELLDGTGFESPLALFGSAGSADAALLAAIRLGRKASAVVCHDGQPDRVMSIERLRAPALFLLSSGDQARIARYRKTDHLLAETELQVISPGSAKVSERSVSWLIARLRGALEATQSAS